MLHATQTDLYKHKKQFPNGLSQKVSVSDPHPKLRKSEYSSYQEQLNIRMIHTGTLSFPPLMLLSMRFLGIQCSTVRSPSVSSKEIAVCHIQYPMLILPYFHFPLSTFFLKASCSQLQTWTLFPTARHH